MEIELKAIDNEKINKIRTASTINVFKYGNDMVEILSIRQEIARRLLDNRCVDEDERHQLYQMLEYYNEKIKLVMGL